MFDPARLVVPMALCAAPLVALAQASEGSSLPGGPRFDRIPPGRHLAPGLCELWYPDRPADRQPPPGDCARVSGVIPPGAWLLLQPAGDERYVHAVVFDARNPGTVAAVGVFDADTGRFVRALEPAARR